MTRRSDTDPPLADFEAALDRVRSRLERLPDRDPFSGQAFDIIERSIADYIRALVLEATRTARRQGADVVSASDVEQAARYLYRSPGRSLMQHVATLGGVLLGAALSNGLALLSADEPSAWAIVVTCGLATVGIAMIVFHLAREIR